MRRRNDEPTTSATSELDALRRHAADLERRLRETDERADAFARIVESIDHHLYISEVLPGGGRRSLFIGPGRDRLLGGVPADGDWGRAWMEAIHPDDRELYAEHTARYLRGEASEVRCRLVGLDGVTRWICGGGMPRRAGDRLFVEGIVRDATAEVRAEELLREASFTDPLTGLANRRRAADVIDAELERARRTGSRPALLLVDVDHFKRVNDTYGHQAGDAVLVEVGRRLHSALRDTDTLARWGGEEFIIVACDVDGRAGLRAIGERLRQIVAASPIRHGNRLLPFTVSVGCVLGDATATADSLVDQADRSLYSAKRLGRDRVRLFSELTPEDLAPEEPEAVRLARALSIAVGVREGVTDMHSHQVGELAGDLARELGLSDDVVLRCRVGGWLHDIGKIAIPDRILNKPGPLDDAEWHVMRAHAAIGAKLVGRVPTVALAGAAVHRHHERYDGGGYPDGLAGDAIPIEARVVAVADAFNAITSDRAYALGRSQPEALAELRRCAGSHHDPQVVAALERVVDRRRALVFHRLDAKAA